MALFTLDTMSQARTWQELSAGVRRKVLTAGSAPSAALKEQIQMRVSTRLAPYQYPREIEFIDALPMTTTGKVQRRLLRER